MKWTAGLFLATCLQVSATGYSQGKITLSLKKASLQKVFAAIEAQSGYTFWYDVTILKNTTPIDIDVKDISLEEALTLACKDQPLEFNITDKMIVIKAKANKPGNDPPEKIEVKGRVVNEKKEPMEGAAVLIKGTKEGTKTDADGNFEIKNINQDAELIISFTGYQDEVMPINGKAFLVISLSILNNPLDEVQVIAYGSNTQRFNVGSITKITSESIAEQPVSNPLAALEGRVPGLVVTQSNGAPGSAFKVQIRGQNSLLQGSDPLFIIDGVPFAPQNVNINQFTSIVAPGGANPNAGGLSPFNSINPNDIESMEILRDADATAIYGSRGANGVVLITTKKGKAGKATFSANIHTGINKISRTMTLMNTPQYLAMRHEAFNNDYITPSAAPNDQGFAPDLLVYDTSQYTDFKKMFFGGNAHLTDANISFSAGNANTQFLLGSGYHHETTVSPGDLSDNRGSFNINLHHISQDQHFQIEFSSNYSFDQNNLAGSGAVSNGFTLPPDYPSLLDSTGKLNWTYKGIPLLNPFAYLLQRYTAKTDNLISHLQLSYQLLPGLSIKSSFGYNALNANETLFQPLISLDPQSNTLSRSYFGTNQFKTWIIEPQIEFQKLVLKGKLDILIGGTAQQNSNSQTNIAASNYSNDALMGSISAAGSVVTSDNYSQYKYAAVFGRLNYIWQNKYIFDLTGRRDGSSRFGANRQFANFGSVGTRWLFSEEPFIKREIKAISYGKLRASFGKTGNDQIGNYQYLSSWGPSIGGTYQGSGGLTPQNLPNPYYSWEINNKLEGGLELGFIKDRILANITWYENRSNNQLINYPLPDQVGFLSVIENFPALIQNKGWEIQLSTINIKNKRFSWSTTFNVTIPKNELIAFPGLDSSSYHSQYIVGQSINVLNKYGSTGVAPSTGVYTFEDQNKDGIISYPKDLKVIGNLDPKFYAGLGNSFGYKGFRLFLFFDIRQQLGTNYLFDLIINQRQPGTPSNQPEKIQDNWHQPRELASIQRFSTGIPGGPVSDAAGNFASSSGAYSDASFIRLKTLYLSFNFSKNKQRKQNSENISIYVQGQNLFLFTKYKGNDPETQNYFQLPLMRTLTAGIQVTL